MSSRLKVLIVGGVAGGASAAARLRRLSEECEIVLFERDEYISFANCGLPYYIGGEIADKSALTIQTPEAFRKRYNVDVRVRHEVVKIDRENKMVSVRNHLAGETYTESYGKLILSPGAEPIRPEGEGFDSDKVFTLRNIPDTYRIKDFIEKNKPKSAAVIGGGYIGLEMAENLHRLGIEISIVQRGGHVLGPLDFDMACDVHRHIESKGVRIYLNNDVRRLEEKEGKLSISLKDTEIAADMAVLAIGVKPESSLARDAGLELDDRGAIFVSEFMLSSDPDIYAIGDAVSIVNFITGQKGYIPLAGPANKQGRIVADDIAGRKTKYPGTQGSSILRVFDMTVATTGLNEAAAKQAGLNYEKIFLWSPSHAGYYPGARNISTKLIFELESRKILGAQLTGYEGVDKRCDVIATAIRGKMSVDELAELELCYAPPYSSAKDPVNMAGFVAQNLCEGLLKTFHWHDVDALQKRDDVVLLDVRAAIEYENGHIDGFINIPLDELRDRLNELDKNKKTYVTCQVGVRGYSATRILEQNGFDAYDLSGGYRLWRSIFGPNDNVPTGKKTHPEKKSVKSIAETKIVDACGLQCPGPIMRLSAAIKEAKEGEVIEMKTTDPAFASDLEGFCRRTGCTLLESSVDKGFAVSKIRKGKENASAETRSGDGGHGKNFIVFSGDLDKAIAVFIMANASAALGRKVSVFFTFWGLNILRRPEKVSVHKNFISKMFSWMMPRGSAKLPLSRMNMCGLGPMLIRSVMKQKNIAGLEELIRSAQDQGVELIACSMSMDVMGIKPEELIEGVKIGGAAAMLAHAEESDMSLFI